MKKALFSLILALACGGLCSAQDPAEGYWISLNERTGLVEAAWEIYVQDGRLYGKVIASAVPVVPNRCRTGYRGFPLEGDVSRMPMMGTPWVFGLVPGDQAGYWKNGRVIDPTNGIMYSCRITFHPEDGGRYRVDTLEMRGYAGFTFLGRSLYFQRTTRESAESLRPPG